MKSAIALSRLCNMLTDYEEILSNEFAKEDIDLEDFYKRHFVKNQLSEVFLPLYLDYYKAKGETSEAEFVETDAGNESNGFDKNSEDLRYCEQKWDDLMMKIQEKMTSAWNANEKTYTNIMNAGNIGLIDCEKQKKVTLKNVIAAKFARYTLFVFIRFFGCPVCFDHVQSLVERAKEFDAKMTNVVIVCKGSKEGGVKWKQLAGVTFPLLADEDGDFVRYLHFGVDIYNLCCTGLFQKRAQLQVTGDTVFKGLVEDKIHSIYQMGGAIIVDCKGQVVYFFKSKDAYERPPVAELLSSIPSPAADSACSSALIDVKKKMTAWSNDGVASSCSVCGGCNIM
uniref:Alkyl hydroperoxide reductase subunit C/ Thiol specific antioxidant domain-containing protein n=1 Tax=Plectus sambesii TaxID=2011161 RepID=A0A914X6C8_9BILA